MTKSIILNIRVLTSQSGQRVDVVVSKSFPEFSRSHIQKWIKEGALTINGKIIKKRKILEEGELIEINAEERGLLKDRPENIKINVVSEDEDILIINKPPNIVVHPGAGNRTGTLVNGLINYDSSLAYLPRAGIVHRLDKNTSGLMVVAKNERSYLHLVKQLKDRSLTRHYFALVVGEPTSGGVIKKPIGRHPRFRTKQTISTRGKEAITEYRLVKRLEGYSLLEVSLQTGRTHQIRVHLSYIGYPIIGDSTYGGRKKFAKGSSENIRKVISDFKRQALHANFLALNHPSSDKLVNFKIELPNDMLVLLNALKDDG